LNRSVVGLIGRQGIDAWRTPEADALLPPGSVCAQCGGTEFRKETDILDVWIDAGVSWFAVAETDPDLKTAYSAFQNGEDVARPGAVFTRGDRRLDPRRAGPRYE
jgi:isoleucyl-tRNA synthetase